MLHSLAEHVVAEHVVPWPGKQAPRAKLKLLVPPATSCLHRLLTGV